MVASNGNCHQKHEPMPCQEETGTEYSLHNELRDNDAINARCCVVNVYVVSLQVRQDDNLQILFRAIKYIQLYSKCLLYILYST